MTGRGLRYGGHWNLGIIFRTQRIIEVDSLLLHLEEVRHGERAGQVRGDGGVLSGDHRLLLLLLLLRLRCGDDVVVLNNNSHIGTLSCSILL